MTSTSCSKGGSSAELSPFRSLIKLRVKDDGTVVDSEKKDFASTYFALWDPAQESHGLGHACASNYDWRLVRPTSMSEVQLGSMLIGHALRPVESEPLRFGFIGEVQSVWSTGQCATLYLLTAMATSLDRFLPEGETSRLLPIHKALNSIREPVIIILLSRFYRRLANAQLDAQHQASGIGLQDLIVDLIRSAISWQPLPEGAYLEIKELLETVENPVSKKRLNDKLVLVKRDTDWPRQLGLFPVGR